METNSSIFDFSLDDEAKSSLITISVWATVGAVAGFISMTFTIIAFLKNLSLINDSPGLVLNFLGIGITVGVMFFLNYFVFLFGLRTKKAMLSDDQAEFNNGLRSFKMYVRFWGLLLIIGIILFMLIVLASLFFFR